MRTMTKLNVGEISVAWIAAGGTESLRLITTARMLGDPWARVI